MTAATQSIVDELLAQSKDIREILSIEIEYRLAPTGDELSSTRNLRFNRRGIRTYERPAIALP